MTTDAPPQMRAIETLLEAVPAHLTETALVVIAALATAYNQFNARRDGKRAGRRSTDMDSVAMRNSQAAIEKQLEELTGEVKVLTSVVRALEDDRRRRD